MPIRAVFFDMGGVIIRTENLAPRRKWEQRFGLPEWGLAEIVFDNPAARRAAVGQASVEEVWAEVGRHLSLSPAELEAMRKDFWRGDVYDEDLLGFIRALRPPFKTGVISNAWPNTREAVKRYINGNTFDAILFSAEEGVEKPGPEIYRRALGGLNIAD
ncbi:MAG: hypothetical protein HY784_09845, partial [Chloroflexi bacterium]|nr:hypothetical protein [Chloroflexota bacterium]